jgi:hypothetical protein
MTKHITKIRGNTQLRLNDLTGGTIKDGTLTQADFATGSFTGEMFLDESIATSKLTDGSKFLFTDGTNPIASNLAMNGYKVTSLGNGTAPQDAVTKSQLDAVASSLSLFEWQPSVLEARTTPAGLNPTTGDRYLIRGVGESTWQYNSNNIAEWGVDHWIYTAPTVGTVVNADQQGDRFYMWDGVSWEVKWLEVTTASTGLIKDGFDVQIDPLAAGDGLLFNAGVLSIGAGNGILVAADEIAVDAGTTALKIPQYDASGNLGIGVAEPESRLHIGGDLKLEGSATLFGLSSVVAPDVAHAVVYYNSIDKRLHLRTSINEQVVGGEEQAVTGEEPVGIMGTVNKSFTLSATPIGNSEAVYMNGLRLTRGMDYSVVGNDIVLEDAPKAGQVIRVDYRHVVLI